jgi:potassium efflux system protein
MVNRMLRILACWLIGMSVLAMLSSYGYAADASGVEQQHFEYLQQQKNEFVKQMNTKFIELNESMVPNDVASLMRKNEESLMVLRGKMTSLTTQLDNQKDQQLRISDQLKQLQKQSSRVPMTAVIQRTQNQLKASYYSGKKAMELMEYNLNLAHQLEALLQAHQRALKIVMAKQERDASLQRLILEKQKLNQYLDKIYTQGIQLQGQDVANRDTQQSLTQEKKILLNGQMIDLIQSKLALLDLTRHWVEAEYNLQKNPSMNSLQAISQTYREGIDALTHQEDMLKQQLLLLTREADRFNTPELLQQWQSLLNQINGQIQEIGIQEQTLQEDLERHEHAINQQLSQRTRLPDFHPSSWWYIAKQISQIPVLFYHYLLHLMVRVYDNFSWQDFSFKLILALSLLSLGGLSYGLQRMLKKGLSETASPRLIRKIYRGFLIILLKNRWSLRWLFMLWFIFYMNDLAYSHYELLFSMIGVFIFFHSLQILAQLTLLDKHTYISEHDVYLYNRVKRLLWVGGISTGLMVFSYQYPLNAYLQDIFNRLFMFFLLMVALVMFRSRELIQQTLLPLLKTNKRYLRHLTLVLMIFVPLTLLSTAVIGLVGYQNLAWTMSRYQAQCLLLMVVYVSLRGVISDVMEMISEWMIASLYNGWLWIEVFLKPLDQIVRLALFGSMLLVLIHLIDAYTNTALIAKMQAALSYVLVNSPGIYITVLSVVKFIALVLVFSWLAKWTREFCYRWLYRQVTDVGIRHSFSVFTQYAVVCVGFFITIRVLGFDFTGLSLILGGLAVGMGFGLRDFASNIVGGLMLLIERPVREGDLVTIGGHEGRVAHIGIRSMRVSSWDNMEVLIPNAETFNKPFTNWTHQDSIVRTVIPIKVSRADDPHVVQKLLMDVLMETPEILTQPPPQAFLNQIEEALISFEVRYFINVNLHTRFEVKSKVLFAISDKFKAAGIKPPIPPLHVEIGH